MASPRSNSRELSEVRARVTRTSAEECAPDGGQRVQRP